MKSIDTLTKPIADRVSSPLYSTFLLAWCVSNWRIFYVTFFISPDKLPVSKIRYIECCLQNYCHTIIIPVVFTVIYILAFPYLEEKVFKIWYKNRAKRKEIQVQAMEKNPVPGEEYRALLDKYIKREEDLNKFYEKERGWLTEKSTLTSDLAASNKRLSECGEKLIQYEAEPTIKQIFPGRCHLTYSQITDSKSPVKGDEFFFINEDNQYVLESDSKKVRFRISYFKYDWANNKVFFVKQGLDDQNPELFFNELIQIDERTFEGMEYGIRKDYSQSFPGPNGRTIHDSIFMSLEVRYRIPSGVKRTT